MTENLADFLLSLECPRCHANAYKITIHKRFKNLWLLMCNKCNTLFALYDAILSPEEEEFLRNAGYVLEPCPRLDMNHEEKVDYIG